MLEHPIEDYATVKTWAEGLRAQWGGDPLAEDPSKLATLAAFCACFDKDPDALVGFCFLRKRATGERFASAKRREVILAKLKDFEAAAGRGVEARRRRSHVVSFLSHNGVLIY